MLCPFESSNLRYCLRPAGNCDFKKVQFTEIDHVMSMLFGLYDWTKGKRYPSMVPRTK